MDSSAQYAGFSDAGKKLKNVAMASAIATLVLPISLPVTFILMSLITSRAYSYFYGDWDAYYAFQENCMIAAWCIYVGIVIFFFLVILNYRIRAYKAFIIAGEQNSNTDMAALAKHDFIKLVMTLIVAPLYAVTFFVFMASAFSPAIMSNSDAKASLLLGNWFATVIVGMYNVVDGFKKWEPIGSMLPSYKGKVGMSLLNASSGVGLAIFIISHYVLAYLLVAVVLAGACTGGSYFSYCSTFFTMGGILVPVGIVTGILTLIAVINHIKGLFRVGNVFIDLEEGRANASPYHGTHYQSTQIATYNTPLNQNAPGTGSGYQHGTWNAPRYSQSMQPMQPVEPVSPTEIPYRDTRAIEAGWQIDAGARAMPAAPPAPKRCKGCQAVLPETEDMAFCPYCGAKV
jgi:hypothetical protein